MLFIAPDAGSIPATSTNAAVDKLAKVVGLSRRSSGVRGPPAVPIKRAKIMKSITQFIDELNINDGDITIDHEWNDLCKITGRWFYGMCTMLGDGGYMQKTPMYITIETGLLPKRMAWVALEEEFEKALIIFNEGKLAHDLRWIDERTPKHQDFLSVR